MASQARLADAPEPAYAGDISAWALFQAELLTTRRPAGFDWVNIAEELKGLSASEFRAFTSALENIIKHLLKWDLQPERRGNSWAGTIAVQRDHAASELAHNPSFQSRIDEAIETAWRRAVRGAAGEMDMAIRSMPVVNPYAWNEIMTRPIDWPEA